MSQHNEGSAEARLLSGRATAAWNKQRRRHLLPETSIDSLLVGLVVGWMPPRYALLSHCLLRWAVMFRKSRWKQTTQSCRRPRRRRDFSGPDEAQLPNQIGLRTRGSRASPETSSQLTSRAREMPDLSTHPRDVRDKPPSTVFTPVLGLTPSVPGVIMSAHGWLSKLWPLFGYPT